MTDKAAKQRRFPIFTALALAGALALIVLDFTSDAQSYAVTAHKEDVNVRLRAMASSGVDIGIKSILERKGDGTLPAGPQSVTKKLADGRVRILVQDEAGKVDLNTATPQLLARAFIFGGAQTDEAQGLARQVVAFRSKQGSGPFSSVTDLLQVPDISEQMFLNIRRYITVHSGLTGIDPDAARAEFLQALPPITADVRRRLRAVRAQLAKGVISRGIGPSDPYFAISPQKVFTITCAADLGGKAVYIQNATIVLRGGKKPYDDVLKRWSGGRINLPGMTASLEERNRKALA